MISGCFYFIKDEFFSSLSECGLMINKGKGHSRPCYYCFEYKGYYWMVPISSKVEKYKAIYEKKKKYRRSDGIVFGYVNGEKRAFLIQNAFPITEDYIDKPYYVEKGTRLVKIKESLSKEINKKLKKVIQLEEKGISITFTDIKRIKEFLDKDR